MLSIQIEMLLLFSSDIEPKVVIENAKQTITVHYTPNICRHKLVLRHWTSLTKMVQLYIFVQFTV